MTPIRRLDEGIAQKIAAGEVIERPASVVKELIENAVDAGSTFISVEIKNGGIDSIRVTDNGCGIPYDEVALAFERHATSKITTAEDLNHIEQLGFRGEALYTIAAVSRLSMVTKPALALSGAQIEIHGGKQIALQEVGCPDGTTIVARDLFYNTPARRKFLAKPATEAGHVAGVVARMLLGRPQTACKLVHESRTIYQSSGDGNLQNAIFAVYGRDIASALIPVEYVAAPYTVQGFIFEPGNARSTREQQVFVVNGRPVRSPMLSTIVDKALGGMVHKGRYPGYVLHLTMPADALDVNVHPNKLTVRFSNDSQARAVLDRAVHAAVDRYVALPRQWSFDEPPEQPAALRSDMPAAVPPPPPPEAAPAPPDTSQEHEHVPMPAPTAPPAQPPTSPRLDVTVADFVARAQAFLQHMPGQTDPWGQDFTLRASQSIPTVAVPPPEPLPPEPPSAQQKVTAERPKVEQPSFTDDVQTAQVLGQAFATYIVVEQGERLLIIDQHAAHERLQYEQYSHLLAQGTVSQPLLVPQTLHVTLSEHEAIRAHLQLFAELGYELHEYGNLCWQIRAVPVFLGQPQMDALLHELLHTLMQDDGRDADARRERLMSIACKSAVKANEPLSHAEIERLLRAIAQENLPLTCPHGRPFVLSITRIALERQFRRRS